MTDANPYWLGCDAGRKGKPHDPPYRFKGSEYDAGYAAGKAAWDRGTPPPRAIRKIPS